MTLRSTTTKHFGHQIIEHRLEVPWIPDNPQAGTFELFAREIVARGGQDRPAIVYFQGGPGFPAPRPLGAQGIVGEMLNSYRVILIDQRGTGRSHRIDAASDAADRSLERLAYLRQEYIVADAEALREALGIKRWSVYGQSFGGFIITSYLSRHPEVIEHAFLTGGLPATSVGVDDIYRATYTKLAERHQLLYREYPWMNKRIREICDHLDNSQEFLPTGERLSSRRFRTVGIDLGRGDGFHSLAYLLEESFHHLKGEKRLRTDFLNDVGSRVSFAAGPLYAAIHESIYGGVIDEQATNWSAHRIREEIPGFEESADPQSGEPFYLTGEHIYPWQFEEDPCLQPFAEPAQALAKHSWAHSPYDSSVIGTAGPVAAACVYVDDIFVPMEYSLQTAKRFDDARLHITNYFQHDGIRHDGPGIWKILEAKVQDH